MTTILTDFFEALTREEQGLATAVRSDSLGLVMRAALNELDLDDYRTRKKQDRTDRDRERSYLMRLGVARLVKVSLEAHQAFDAPTLTFRRTPEVSQPVLRLIEEFGILEHGRRVAQSVAAGFASIERLGDKFLINLPAIMPDTEHSERVVARAYKEQARAAMAERIRSADGDKLREQLSKLFEELVYPYAQHFIGYEADPTLDITFFGLAYHEITLTDEYDNFHYATRFGGITFQNWKLAAAFILSVAMRHEHFAEALIAKEPQVRIEDILTVSVDTDPFVASLGDFINYFGTEFEGHVAVTSGQARRIFDVLSISPRNTKLLDRPGAPFPPLVQCSEQHVIRPLFGASTDLMLFLLNSLQHHYRADYDRAQRQRERAMQSGAKRILREVLPHLEFRDNVRIRRGRETATDIDLVALDSVSGVVMLCQLKHQDPYGADLGAYKERTARLKQQVSKWVSVVASWAAEVDEATLRPTLRLPKNFPSPTIRMLVLTRHFAHTLRALGVPAEVHYANWNQLVHAAQLALRAPERPRHLDEFMASLTSLVRPATEEEFLPEPQSDWNVGNLRFSVVQLSE